MVPHVAAIVLGVQVVHTAASVRNKNNNDFNHKSGAVR